MEERYGTRGTTTGNVFFTEESVRAANTIRHVHIEISRQNANLIEVKQKLATEVQACGGNVLANFRYGQRKHAWWEYVFSFKWDTESWYGEGDALKL